MKTRLVLGAILIALTTTGSDCINDGFLVSVNIEGLSGTYAINAGPTLSFNESATVPSSTYLNADFGSYEGVRIYDVQVHTVGTYGGNATGTVNVNGSPALSFNGSWAAFNTPQSILNSNLITRNPAGVTTLINAILQGQDVTLQAVGSVSQGPVPSGLSIVVDILAQVDAQP